MLTESAALAKILEAAVGAGEAAGLSAAGSAGVESLLHRQLASRLGESGLRETGLWDTGLRNSRRSLFGLSERENNPYLSLRYNEVSRECSEYLCDHGITPWAWAEADSQGRMEMLQSAVQIIGRELRLPEEWVRGISPEAVSGEAYMAQASCRIRPLLNGGVDIVGVPTLHVNADYLTDDYFEAMSTVYHEMIHMKQYASIDCVAPGLTTDNRLLDLIQDLKNNDGTPSSRVSYLYSPYEAEAWAQESYFKEMLQAVVADRYA